MALRRASRDWEAKVLITPASATATPADPASSTPKPVAMSPEYTPNTRSTLGGGNGVENFVSDVVVGVDGLDVVLLLEGFDQPHPRRGVLALHAHRGLRDHVHLGFEHRHALALKRLANRLHFIRGRRDLENFFDVLDVRGTRVQRLLEQVIFPDLVGVHLDDPAPLEHPGHAVGRAHPALVLLEDMADLRPGAVLVVGERAHQHRYP